MAQSPLPRCHCHHARACASLIQGAHQSSPSVDHGGGVGTGACPGVSSCLGYPEQDSRVVAASEAAAAAARLSLFALWVLKRVFLWALTRFLQRASRIPSQARHQRRQQRQPVLARAQICGLEAALWPHESPHPSGQSPGVGNLRHPCSGAKLSTARASQALVVQHHICRRACASLEAIR